MTLAITSAIAPNFQWSGHADDVVLVFGAGPSPVQAPLATAIYRMVLGPTSGGGDGLDALNALEGLINAALVSAGRATVVTVRMNASGRVVFTSSETCKLQWAHGTGQLFGFTAATYTGIMQVTAEQAPKYLCLLASRQSQMWSPKTPMAGAETVDGRGYGVLSGVRRWEDSFTFGFIPRDASVAASRGYVVSPWEPLAADLGSIGSHDVPWSIQDVLETSLAKTCAFARGNFQALRDPTSTERYDLCTIPSGELAEPQVSYAFSPWEVFVTWKPRLLRQGTTPTGVRT